MAVGHEALMSGHLGKGKTADRIMSSFYWPGAMADIKRFCASCDSCQRASPRGSTRKVPLVSAPLIDTPFRRVAVDLHRRRTEETGPGKGVRWLGGQWDGRVNVNHKLASKTADAGRGEIRKVVGVIRAVS